MSDDATPGEMVSEKNREIARLRADLARVTEERDGLVRDFVQQSGRATRATELADAWRAMALALREMADCRLEAVSPFSDRFQAVAARILAAEARLRAMGVDPDTFERLEEEPKG